MPKMVISFCLPSAELEPFTTLLGQADGSGLRMEDGVVVGCRHLWGAAHRPADPDMTLSYIAAISRMMPTITEEDLAAIEGHQSVLYLAGPELDEGEDLLGPVMDAFGMIDLFLKVGAISAKCESSAIAHGAASWVRLYAELREAHGDGDASGLVQVLNQAFVQGQIRNDDGVLYSCGHHLLGCPEIAVHESDCDDEVPAEALLIILGQYQHPLNDTNPLQDGEDAPLPPHFPRFTSHHQPDGTLPPDDLFHNPWGFWRLKRAAAPPPSKPRWKLWG